MHKIRAWAHNTAQEHKFNPWAAGVEKFRSSSASDGTPDQQQLENGETTNEKPKKPLFRRMWEPFKIVALHSWINVLLVFVPLGIAVNFAGVNKNVVFGLNAIAIIPLAGLLTFATECVAHRLGPTLGALMNVSFGNAVELIIFIIALVKNEIRVVQASLVGSILANLLLILGMALFIGGLEFQEQVYDSMVTQTSACLLAVASLSLLIPTAFHASFSDTKQADAAVLPISRGSSVILLVVYVLYLLFQLKSHSYLYQGTPQHVIDEATQPGILQRLDSSSSSDTASVSGASVSSTSTSRSGGTRRKVTKKLKVKLGLRRRTKIEEEVIDEEPTNAAGPSEVTEKSETEMERADEPQAIRGARTEPAETVAVNTALAKPAPAVNRRPHIGGRMPTLRAPPIFRAESLLDPPTTSRHHYETQRGDGLRRMQSTPNMTRRGTGGVAIRNGPPGGQAGYPDRVNTTPSAAGSPDQEDQPPISQTAAIITLLISTGLVAFCAELLVGSIQHLVEHSSLSEAFIGLIILPIVGNAAEHVTAVTVAAKNKLDLSMGVSLGSSIQIALFVTPLIVIIGWILNKEMSLYFTLFETAALFVSVFIVNFLVLDGRSNFLEGALLCASYIIIALGTYYYPNDSGGQTNSFASGETTRLTS